MNKFECHITTTMPNIVRVEEFAKANPDWKFSVIDGDPALGSGRRCYLTKHSDDLKKLHTEAHEVAAKIDEVVRIKIEFTSFDSLSGGTMLDPDDLLAANKKQVQTLNAQDMKIRHLEGQLAKAQAEKPAAVKPAPEAAGHRAPPADR